jgi:hypothetical protein
MRCFKLASFILEVREQICTQGTRGNMEIEVYPTFPEGVRNPPPPVSFSNLFYSATDFPNFSSKMETARVATDVF